MHCLNEAGFAAVIVHYAIPDMAYRANGEQYLRKRVYSCSFFMVWLNAVVISLMLKSFFSNHCAGAR